MGDATRKLEMNAALWAIDKVLSNLTELRAKVRRKRGTGAPTATPDCWRNMATCSGVRCLASQA